MAERIQTVMDMVEQKLDQNPDISTEDLFTQAKKLEPAIGKLDIRQFNARYPLQVKRKRAGVTRSRRASGADSPAKSSRRRWGAAATSAIRDAVRATMLEFARELADAETKTDVVTVISNVDSHVERIMAATGRN